MTLHDLTLDRLSRALDAPRPGASSDYDLNPEIRAHLPEGRSLRPAAVLVPVVERPAGLSVLLTRRSVRLRHHPGQIAFPGGRMDPGDASRWHAALREAREEIGLAPELVAPLGRLDRHETVTAFDVEPHVGLVRGDFVVTPCEDEVAEVFEVPLAFVLNPAHFQTHSRIWQGTPRQYWAVPYGPYYIWGATARMLKGLSERVLTA
ncbi:CoA pyrophosphatase [Halovulum dunhuangense]|uniref:CoA pyrophosphatase n=1 Tax=Halovulum dunhuangense TaxID=1505036 RepID=A0A849KUJ7_9RHOB|nr:CoA pyrophosphatase [Halovulum dunhuangense]NNU79281.1 CoA pyrophosphatase [Halovulum dunhuangense]